MEDKTRKLLLVMEMLALLVAGILILIDYKLKQDLVALTRNVENALDNARTIISSDSSPGDDTSGLHNSNLVGNASPMEAGSASDKTHANGKAETVRSTRTATKRSGGNRSTQVPRPSDPVGP